MVCRFERTFLHRIKLNPLHLDLENRRKLADGSELLGHRVFHADLLNIKCPIDGIVDVSRSVSNINLDVTPSFVLRTCAFIGGDVRAGLAVEQADERVKIGTIVYGCHDLLFDLVKLFTVTANASRLDGALALEQNVVDDFCHILLGTNFHLLLQLFFPINLREVARRDGGW